MLIRQLSGRRFSCYFLTGLLLILDFNTSFADIHGIVTGTTNYVGRGYTKSNNGLAIQGNLDYQHSSGFYLGAYASNVNFGDRSYKNSAKVEFSPYLGVTQKLADNWQVEVQWVRYLYDGKIFGRQADYNEFQLLLHYHDLLTVRASVSDDFYGQQKVTGDYEATITYPITDLLEVTTGLGYSQVEQVLEYDYLYWNVGFTARYKFIVADLRYMQSYEATVADKTSWRYDPEFLHPTVVFSLSVGF
jgi:uncharacterized protein (TIGR02001 family)